MDINKILNEYDLMFGKNNLKEIEDFLVNHIYIAKQMGREDVRITLLNELIGFCRDTTQKDKALYYSGELKSLMDNLGFKGRVDYATSLLNIANAYRAFGLFAESQELYETVLKIYEEKMPENDFNFASLYNNWSLLYQEVKDYSMAKEMLLKALKVVDSYSQAIIPQANTRTNLAATLIAMGGESDFDEAISYLKEALDVYEKDGGQDFHYGAALVAMGDAKVFIKDYKSAVDYYGRGMKEIEKHVGKTDNYHRVFEKYEMAKSKCSESKEINNIERCRAFYEKYGKNMILEKFPDYYEKIAVGVVGEGSDCFGFEDEISKDHDFGIGFCMWLTEDDFTAIGEQLQAAYEELVLSTVSKKTYDKTSVEINKFIDSRRGVFSINNFYNGLLGTSLDFENEFNLDYKMVNELSLAVATNGQVFFDELGVFTKAREALLKYYPDNIWRGKIAQCVHDFSQYAQSNYPRMMARKDYVTSILCISKAIETAMDLVYLLNRKYAPYYKWKKKGVKELEKLSGIGELLEELALLSLQDNAWNEYSYSPQVLNVNDRCVVIFEEMAKLFVKELNKQGLIIGEDTFLEVYINQIVKGIKMDIVDKIIEIEWRQFDKVKNEGGRADCQDDFNTFSIMRKSQYLSWTEELLDSYYNDLLVADSKGWNMIMEKYARMMESTAPDRYDQLKKDIPELTSDRIAIQEEIIKIQVSWMKEFASQYPKMAGNARSITTSEDTPYNTSYETYLRGEISTYSERTFKMYGSFVVGLLKENKNLARMIMENTAKLYGYESLEDAEKRL